MILAALLSLVSLVASAQEPGVLRISIVLADAEGRATPVPRHVLLISDNPATAGPRRVVTALDGTATVRLRPGNYTVESDRPVAFQGKAYSWTQTLDILAGRDAVLDLTADNAEVEPVTSEATSAGPALEAEPSGLLMQWQDSVVAIWTPTTRASGFVVDADGLIATSQRAIGAETSVAVQLTPAVKVAGRVLVADPVRDVAVVWIDPKAAVSAKPVPLGCAGPARSPLVDGQEIVAIVASLRERKDLRFGAVKRMEPLVITSDLRFARDSAGGPVFTMDGVVAGITSIGDGKEEGRPGDSRIVRVEAACDVMAEAERKMQGAAPPGGGLLPVEPERPFPADALKDAATHRAGSLNPIMMSSSDFDVAFITPVRAYAGQEQTATRAPLDFGRWSDYVADFPPVLLVRVTPKLAEGFWTTVARGAAQTQGVSIPPIMRYKSGFSRLRVFCGDAEVTPIHPFTLDLRVSDTDTIDEGLYVFGPDALGPHCGTVKLVLYSEKEPEKGDTRVVDPKIVEQIWQDFAPYRDLSQESRVRE
jgi:hypothetical protein